MSQLRSRNRSRNYTGDLGIVESSLCNPNFLSMSLNSIMYRHALSLRSHSLQILSMQWYSRSVYKFHISLSIMWSPWSSLGWSWKTAAYRSLCSGGKPYKFCGEHIEEGISPTKCSRFNGLHRQTFQIGGFPVVESSEIIIWYSTRQRWSVSTLVF